MTIAATAPDTLEPLTVDECLSLLPTRAVGRLAVVRDGLPVVLPVNYAFVDGTVVFRTGAGLLLDTAASGAHVAFEVDDVDEQAHRGWSVLVTGRAQEVWDAVESTTALERVGRPWPGGARPHVVRVMSATITGRRITGLDPNVSEWWG